MVGIALCCECGKAAVDECVECGETERWSGGEALVAEALQDVIVLRSMQAIGFCDDGIHGSAQMPALGFVGDGWPRPRRLWLAPGVAELLLPQRCVAGMVAAEAKAGVGEEMTRLIGQLWGREVHEDIQAYMSSSLLAQKPVECEAVHQADQRKSNGIRSLVRPAFNADRVSAKNTRRQHGGYCCS